MGKRKDKKKMYEGYEVMKSDGEGRVVLNSDNIFDSASSSPTATNQNPNFKFTSLENPHFPFNIPKEEYISMIESGSGMSIGSGKDPVEDTAIEQKPPPAKKKRFHRHTFSQIQEMEAFFNVNPHPSDEQREILSRELGLTPLQVKFWFQNKRNQLKAQQHRRDNAMLKADNNTLKTENHNLQSSLQCLSCSSCGNKLHLDNFRLENSRLRLENSCLHYELDRLRSIAMKMNPPPSQEIVSFFPVTNNNNNNNMLILKEEKVIAMDLAVFCSQELVKMCDTNEPLWNKKRSDDETVCLNEEEYKKMFHSNNYGDPFRREASRANAVVMMNSITLVKAFLDADKWSEMFSSIVSRAKTIQIISSGVSGANASLHLMYAEFQVITPLIPTREAYFLRYVEQNSKDGKWIIVDFPIDGIKPASATTTTTTDQYRRKPSGCVIEEMSDGYSQVTWVEHVEVEEKHELHEAVREYVKSGMAFGAERWLAVLKRQCERMASLMATNITDLGVIPSIEARKNLMKLSQIMVRTFCLDISNSYGQASTKDTMRITTRKVCGGLVPCVVSVTFLPYSHHQVFDLLRNNQRLSQMGILFNGNSFQEVAHIANGSHPGNCISLLQINVANSSHNVELILQETCTDSSGSLVVYSTVDADAVQFVMNGEDPSKVPLLPLGYSVVPVNPTDGVEGISLNLPSCLLTVAEQVLGSTVATARLDLSTVAAINNRICSTVNSITSALVNDVGN